MKDYSTVDVRDIKLKGTELVMEVSNRCEKRISSVPIWTHKAIPSVVLLTLDQFKEFAGLQEEPNAKPTGKEQFKTKQGYVLEMKVEG